jgi:uncharacterized membrane protein HdeD (DUF308 family)
MIFKKDNFVFGLILGLIAPALGFMLFKFYKFSSYSLPEMLQFLKENPNLISVFISVSLMANAILFTIYINSHRDKTGKGIFVLTIVYAIIAMIYKYY